MLLKRLTDARGAAGDEGEIRDLLKVLCAELGVETRVDRMGNLIATKPGPTGSRTLMLDGHMDEVGFMITGVEDSGLLRYQPVGGIDPRVVVSKRVQVGKARVPGVIGAKAIHLQSADDMQRVLGHGDMYIDVGASSKDEAEKLCPAGTYVCFDSPLTVFGDNRVFSKALDDRVGCYSMLKALELDNLPVNLVCVFAVQEEVGMRGAQVAAQHVQPDLAIALEGTTCNDLGDVDFDQQVCNLGQGVAISFMDHASIAHHGLHDALFDCAKKHGIAHQHKRGVAGGNDGGPLQRSYGGRPTTVLSVPCRYIHSAVNVASLHDIEAQAALVCAFVRDFAEYEGRIFA